jgi:hypothetical protein
VKGATARLDQRPGVVERPLYRNEELIERLLTKRPWTRRYTEEVALRPRAPRAAILPLPAA